MQSAAPNDAGDMIAKRLRIANHFEHDPQTVCFAIITAKAR